MSKKSKYIILTIIWMGFIFCMSNQPANISKELSQNIENLLNNTPIIGNLLSDILNSPNSQFIVRKSAHIILFCFLSILCFVVIYELKRNVKISTLASFSITFIYACMDEIHQLFIPGRSGKINDVLIDSIGVIMGLIFINLIFMLNNKIKKSYSGNE
nr:VanZ family protein [uncultured Romboutsia sp.]